MIVQVGPTPVQIEGGVARWTSGMEADCDGSPRAYAPEGSALQPLDWLANAGAPGNFFGLACDENGEPYVQTKDDCCPGFYVSTTALGDHTKQTRDPRRYVDSETVPYISVPRVLLIAGVKLGDLAVVEYRGIRAGAIVADVGPAHAIGEGSLALHLALGMDPRRAMPKHRLVGIDSGVSYTVYLGSAASPPWPRINVSALALAWAAAHPA